MISENNLENWPSSNLYIPEALETIGISLLGPEALDPSMERLPLSLRNGLRMLVQVCWGNLRRQIQKNTGKLELLELVAIATMEGKLSLLISIFRLSCLQWLKKLFQCLYILQGSNYYEIMAQSIVMKPFLS